MVHQAELYLNLWTRVPLKVSTLSYHKNVRGLSVPLGCHILMMHFAYAGMSES
jgi:hypothetical protein